MIYTLERTIMNERGTLGMLKGPGIPTLFTLEEPWKNNQRRISCIPAGTYQCVPHAWGADRDKFHFKQVWRLEKVPGRIGVLIHAGNSLKDTEGCILVGRVASGMGLGESRNAIADLRKAIGEKSFTLVITEAPNARK